MTFREKSNWAVIGVLTVVFGGYVVAVASRAASARTEQPEIIDLAVWGVIGIVVLLVIVHIAMAAIAPPLRGEHARMEGRQAGYAILAAGAVIAVVIALNDADAFWVANVLITALVAGEIANAAAAIAHERTNARIRQA